MSGRNLRRRPRISYYEPEEPSLDEYVFCDECYDYVYEYCAIHGDLLIIPDDKVPVKTDLPSYVPRAALTIPKVFLHIAPSIIPGAGLGVYSTLTLPRGVRFGPYGGQHTKRVTSMYCWQIYDRDRKRSHVVDAGDPNRSNWMRYVNCARHWHEQNLVAYQYQGQLYYRTIKIIPRFTELMVFYGGEFAHQLNIDLGRYNAPSGYAQKFGAPVVKKPKLNTQAVTTEIKSSKKADNIRNNARFSSKTVPNKDSKKSVASTNSNKKSTANNSGNTNFTHKNIISDNVGQEITSNIIKTPLDISTTNLNSDISTIDKVGDQNNNIENTNNTVVNVNTSNKSDKINNKSNLSSIKRTHSGNKSYTCDICSKSFTYNCYLLRHLLIHSGEKPFGCDVCGVSFTLKGNLKSHYLIHTGDKPYKCNVCGKTFRQNNSLKKHSITHSGHKPYSCDTCGKRFNRSCNLKKHALIHTGVRPYHCDICGKNFNQSSHLKIHYLIHTGDKRYKCNICGKTFRQNSNLKVHSRIHTSEKPAKLQCL